MKREKPDTFATEVDLCARFLSALPKTWTPYAETGGWDILLVRNGDGFQIGVQAKLKLNVEVFNQTLESFYYSPETIGPDCRAILVPESATAALDKIAAYVGVTVIKVRTPDRPHVRSFVYQPELPDEKEHSYSLRDWHEWVPVRRHKLPEYVPDVPAGASAPLQLTQWKIGALKIAATLDIRGFVTRDDFKEHGVDHRRWTAAFPGWLKKGEQGWVRAAMPDFRAQHPKVYEQIKADAPKWLPAVVAESPKPKQADLLKAASA